ncbi:hypothetical protein PSTT_13649 [Puccinia striiformis]|uniref:Uncharacterized protein n=1 Tax=Puccinia striiformis TaxID=27350 RepID=A0A2S4UQP7_9BASI|nr:hypothetical protein PSTT_13649 [Puccinia striiformis]
MNSTSLSPPLLLALIFESKLQNRMAEAATLFDSICNSQWFLSNKIDLFKAKLLTSLLSSRFPNYDGDNSYESAAKFIYWTFLQMCRGPNKDLITHFTCATDSQQISIALACGCRGVNPQEKFGSSPMVSLTKILVAIQLLHRYSVSAYPQVIEKDLVKGSEGILGGATSNSHLPEPVTLTSGELQSGNHQLEGTSLENHREWLVGEIIPTSGNVGHQEKPVGIDDSKTLDKIHSSKGETETGVERGEQASHSSVLEEVKYRDEESSQQAIAPSLLELKTQNQVQRYVQNYVLEALGRLNNNVSDLAEGLSWDVKFCRAQLDKITSLVTPHTGVPHDPML